MRCLLLSLAAGLLVLPSPGAEESPLPRVQDENFHIELKTVAKDYRAWGRIDDESHWAPGLCRAPHPGSAYASESDDDETHGRKLYSLFAQDPAAYLKPFVKQLPIGLVLRDKLERPKTGMAQAVVKESWVPREATEKEVVEAGNMWIEGKFNPYVKRGKKVYKADKQADLFIMLKLDPKTPGTDEGWVYGTVTPDGKTVTSAGKVESCMKCHVEAKKDRLFGPPASPWIIRDR